MPDHAFSGRRVGILVPLFSIPSSASWGIGEIGDLPALGAWARAAGISIIQLLPINEMADGQSSPYSALSAMAIDPIFISIRNLPNSQEDDGEGSWQVNAGALESVRRASSVDHGSVRELKTRALRQLFDEFYLQWQRGGPAPDALRQYIESQAWWLDDYTLFRALHAENEGRCWIEWEEDVRRRRPDALIGTRRRLGREMLYYAWLQWVAAEQWTAARRELRDVEILGDFPFMVSSDSADVWSRQQEFRVDASVGVPPDAFSDTGQDWGLPVYRWDVQQGNDYEWLRERARRCADLYDGFRVDHLVGFYRTFVREKDGTTYFVPAEEHDQLAQGERLMRLFQESGAGIIAEDLGTVPDVVRESLARLRVPGLKVLRWERDWHAPGQPFRDPAVYPRVSVAISGTHDTEPVAEWWDGAEPEERAQVIQLPHFRERNITVEEPYSDRIRDAVLESLYSSASDLMLVPVQDVFGWRDRINVPAQVDDTNWCWRLPWPVERLTTEPDAIERSRHLRELARRYGRG
jgi:4-alpha-glucanotransferase